MQHVDLTYLSSRTKANPEQMRELIDIYMEQTPVLITAMREGFQTGDWRLVKAAAHKIIPSFYIMGITGDYEASAKKIQEAANEPVDKATIADLITHIETKCNNVYTELNELLKTLKKL